MSSLLFPKVSKQSRPDLDTRSALTAGPPALVPLRLCRLASRSEAAGQVQAAGSAGIFRPGIARSRADVEEVKTLLSKITVVSLQPEASNLPWAAQDPS